MDPPWIDGPSHWGDPEYEDAMNKELCNALAEAGILERINTTPEYAMRTGPTSRLIIGKASRTLADWRVAGACLERLKDQQKCVYMPDTPYGHERNAVIISRWEQEEFGPNEVEETSAEGDSLPRAIITAFVESRNG